jgi:hypothetical protein
MASFLERTLSNHQRANDRNIAAAKNGNSSDIKVFGAQDSMMPAEFLHIDEHKRESSAERFIRNWLPTVK